MKELVINNSINLIKKQFPEYSKEKLEEIEYGLIGLYLTISKALIIIMIATILGLAKELIIFILIYNVIRMPSFGLHAKNSLWCLVSSTILFICLPYLCSAVIIPIWSKVILGIIGIFFIAKNSPADTHKRPIINQTKRKIYKFISTIIAILYVVLSLIIPNNFLENCLIVSLILQCIITAPLTYRIFNMPYNNYKKYISQV